MKLIEKFGLLIYIWASVGVVSRDPFISTIALLSSLIGAALFLFGNARVK